MAFAIANFQCQWTVHLGFWGTIIRLTTGFTGVVIITIDHCLFSVVITRKTGADLVALVALANRTELKWSGFESDRQSIQQPILYY